MITIADISMYIVIQNIFTSHVHNTQLAYMSTLVLNL